MHLRIGAGSGFRWLALAGGLLAQAAAAQPCDFWKQIQFPGGEKACIGEYPFAYQASGGQTVLDQVSRSGSYVVAAPTGPKCPRTVGFAANAQSGEQAVAACSAALLPQEAAQCACEPIVFTGVTTIPKARFDALFGVESKKSAAVDPLKAPLAALAALGQALAVNSSGACPYWHVLQFPDGAKACLSEYPFARSVPAGFAVPVRDMVPRNMRFSLAFSVGGACPLVVGAAAGASTSIGQGQETPQQDASALGACNTALERAGVKACGCEVLVTNGAVKVGRDELEQKLGGR